MKAKVPAVICFAVFLYFCWMVQRSRISHVPPDTTDKVEVTVHGPDGEIIKPIARAVR